MNVHQKIVKDNAGTIVEEYREGHELRKLTEKNLSIRNSLRDSCPKKGVYFTIPLEFLMKLMILCISSLIGTWSSIFCKASCTLKFPWYTRR